MSKNELIQTLRTRAGLYPLWADLLNAAVEAIEESEKWKQRAHDKHREIIALRRSLAREIAPGLYAEAEAKANAKGKSSVQKYLEDRAQRAFLIRSGDPSLLRGGPLSEISPGRYAWTLKGPCYECKSDGPTSPRSRCVTCEHRRAVFNEQEAERLRDALGQIVEKLDAGATVDDVATLARHHWRA